jgi:hypothetical protein
MHLQHEVESRQFQKSQLGTCNEAARLVVPIQLCIASGWCNHSQTHASYAHSLNTMVLYGFVDISNFKFKKLALFCWDRSDTNEGRTLKESHTYEKRPT